MKYFVLIALVMMSRVALAQNLVSLSANKDRVLVNERIDLAVQLEVKGSLIWCGIHVDFGDGGDPLDVRAEQNPFRFTKEYKSPGRYVIRVKGQGAFRGLKSALPCFGDDKSVAITVSDSPPAAMAPQRVAPPGSPAPTVSDRDAALSAENQELREKIKAAENQELRERLKRLQAESPGVDAPVPPPKAKPPLRVKPPSLPASKPHPIDDSLKVN